MRANSMQVRRTDRNLAQHEIVYVPQILLRIKRQRWMRTALMERDTPSARLPDLTPECVP